MIAGKSLQVTTDIIQKTYTYLLATATLVPEEYQTNIKSLVTSIASETKLTEPDSSAVAEATFILEQQFEKISKLAMVEEVVAKLNQLRTAIARQNIKELREQMAMVEDEAQLELLQSISQWEGRLRERPITPEDIQTEKD